MKNVSVLTALIIAVSLIDSALSFFQFLQSKNPGTVPRLAGGNAAQHGQFPWIVSIQYREEDGWKHDCGGAIIDSKHIVTAGHCVWSRDIQSIEVVAGAHNIQLDEASQQRRRLEKIFLHPNYTSGDSPGPFDIAILSIKRVFKFTKFVKKIDVARCNEQPKIDDECIYSGWGNLFPVSPFYYKGSDVLMTEPTAIIALDECKKAYSLYPKALDTAICSRSGLLHGTCQGDSGGPLTCYRDKSKKNTKKVPYLSGVVSFGFPVCNDGYHPDVYTNLGNPQICTYFKKFEKLAEQNKIVWKKKN